MKATKRLLFDLLQEMIDGPCSDPDEGLDEKVDFDDFVEGLSDTLRSLVEDASREE